MTPAVQISFKRLSTLLNSTISWLYRTPVDGVDFDSLSSGVAILAEAKELLRAAFQLAPSSSDSLSSTTPSAGNIQRDPVSVERTVTRSFAHTTALPYPHHPPPKQRKKRDNPKQARALNKVHARTTIPSAKQQQELAAKPNMTTEEVQIWYISFFTVSTVHLISPLGQRSDGYMVLSPCRDLLLVKRLTRMHVPQTLRLLILTTRPRYLRTVRLQPPFADHIQCVDSGHPLFLNFDASAYKRLIRRTFALHELPSLIEAISSGEDKSDAADHLHGDDAQTLIDVIDEARSPLASHCDT